MDNRYGSRKIKELKKAQQVAEVLAAEAQMQQLKRQGMSDAEALKFIRSERYRMNQERKAAAEQMQADRIAQEQREYDKDRELERLMADRIAQEQREHDKDRELERLITEVERLNSVQPDAAPVATEHGKKARIMDRVNQVIENYIANRSGVRLAGEGLATALGAGVLYEFIDPEEVVQDPAAARQYQGSLN